MNGSCTGLLELNDAVCRIDQDTARLEGFFLGMFTPFIAAMLVFFSYHAAHYLMDRWRSK